MLRFQEYLTESAKLRKFLEGNGHQIHNIPGAEVVHHDPEMGRTIYHFLEPKAAHFFGSKSRFCTNTNQTYHAHRYLQHGNLFGIHEPDGERIQLFLSHHNHMSSEVGTANPINKGQAELRDQVGKSQIEQLKKIPHKTENTPPWEPPSDHDRIADHVQARGGTLNDDLRAMIARVRNHNYDDVQEGWIMKKPTVRDHFDNFYQSRQRNAWLEDPHMKVYVRKGMVMHQGRMHDTIDVANVKVKEKHQGKGHFKKLMQHLESKYPDKMIHVENIQNPDLETNLRKHGYVDVSGKRALIPSLVKKSR